MRKRAIFHPEAENEFLASVEYYANQSGGLGERFDEEIKRLVAQIEAHPRRFGPWRHGTWLVLCSVRQATGSSSR